MRKYIPTLLAVLLAALTSVNATAAGNYYLFVSDANGQTAQSIEMPKCITFTDTLICCSTFRTGQRKSWLSTE